MDQMICMENIHKRYFEGKGNELQVLHGVNLTVYKGEFISIVGESGSGKSTMMNIIGLLDKPSDGTYSLNGIDISREPDWTLSKIRNREIGFVFQTFNLIGRTNALRNVEMPMFYAGVPKGKRRARAKELLSMVGVGDRMSHRPNELSGGQKQRVAIARAMANDPSIILADEPTGALDSSTGHLVMDIFHDLHRNHGKTIILVTHNRDLAERTERIITLHDGEIISERRGAGTRFPESAAG
jgi:putative ABC transport system ATP-binding protein